MKKSLAARCLALVGPIGLHGGQVVTRSKRRAHAELDLAR